MVRIAEGLVIGHGQKRSEFAFCDGMQTGIKQAGCTSVWNQQKGYFEGRCPRQSFVDDLCKEVEGWLEAGDQLVIGKDANDDVRCSTLTKCWGWWKVLHRGMG